MYKIIGAKGLIQNIDDFLEKIRVFSEENKVTLQVFDADVIYGEKHLVSALIHAKRAFEKGKNTTNTLEMEILLYAAGERQLKLAIPKIGFKKGEVTIAALFYNDDKVDLEPIVEKFLKKFDLENDNKVLKGDINTLKKFKISDSEIKTVSEDKYGDLILEQIAMVDIIK